MYARALPSFMLKRSLFAKFFFRCYDLYSVISYCSYNAPIIQFACTLLIGLRVAYRVNLGIEKGTRF